jgi:hypothetical protein
MSCGDHDGAARRDGSHRREGGPDGAVRAALVIALTAWR